VVNLDPLYLQLPMICLSPRNKMAHKSCVLDPIPAKILLECFTNLLPVITNVINNSLETATVPRNLKCMAL
jgi:hypothetical protein